MLYAIETADEMMKKSKFVRKCGIARVVLGTWFSSALEVFLNDMRYINPRFTYFTYLLTYLYWYLSCTLSAVFQLGA